MPDPGFTRPDLCSIPVADVEAEPAGAVLGGLSADDHPPTGDDPPASSPRGIDRAIRLSTAAAVLAVAGIAAYVSYGHACAVVRAHGETGITARLESATIDGLVYASSMAVLYAARHRVSVPSLARWRAAAHQRLRKERELVVEARQAAYPRTDGPYRPVLAGPAAEAPSLPNQAGSPCQRRCRHSKPGNAGRDRRPQGPAEGQCQPGRADAGTAPRRLHPRGPPSPGA